MTITVAVTGAGGPSGVSFMQGVEGPDVRIIAADSDVYGAGLYLVPEDRRWLVRRGSDPCFVDEILARCGAEQVDVLVPTVDTELLPLARRRDDFSACGTRLLLADESTLAICLDKALSMAVCASVCPVPRTALVDSTFDLVSWPLPFLVKPRAGAGGRGVLVIERTEDLVCSRDGQYIAQEFLPGIEYSVDVLSSPTGEVLAAVPRSRLKIDSGVAVAARTLHSPQLEEFAAAVARRIGLTYVANVQFREDRDGLPRLLEINARFPGTMPLTVESGVNMPRIALDLALGLPAPERCGDFRDVGMVRTWQEHFVSADAFQGVAERAAALVEA